MLKPMELGGLNWHPLRNGRSETNYALASHGYDALGGLRYTMACGHNSLPGRTICERGCLRAPTWPEVKKPLPEGIAAAFKFMNRHGIREDTHHFEDAHRIAARRIA